MLYNFILVGIVILSMAMLGYGESIPDYYNPYAPIITDKKVYTWTDKIYLKVIAPSWNENRFGIDSIGGDPDHSIRIFTHQDSLDQYRLVETSSNSGVFTGSITLSGFEHDIDGDRRPDITPQTFGNGPNDGRLAVEHDSAVTISFEFAKDVILRESFTVSWNIRQIHLDDDTVYVTDPDMNINPETLDQIMISIYSDSDQSGISLRMVETEPSSGIFMGIIPISHTSEHNALHIVHGDNITIQYDDYTLPKPHSTSDVLSIKESFLYSNDDMVTENLAIVVDDNITVDSQTVLVGGVHNMADYEQDFVYLIQVSHNDTVVSLGWITSKLDPKQVLDLSYSWVPDKSGRYTINSFVWRSLDNPVALAPTISTVLDIQ